MNSRMLKFNSFHLALVLLSLCWRIVRDDICVNSVCGPSHGGVVTGTEVNFTEFLVTYYCTALNLEHQLSGI
jgi:hypothetical protein